MDRYDINPSYTAMSHGMGCTTPHGNYARFNGGVIIEPIPQGYKYKPGYLEFNNMNNWTTTENHIKPCPKGTKGKVDYTCEPCPMGEYQDETGQASCKPCPTGGYTINTGSESCEICDTGCLLTPSSSGIGCQTPTWDNFPDKNGTYPIDRSSVGGYLSNYDWNDGVQPTNAYQVISTPIHYFTDDGTQTGNALFIGGPFLDYQWHGNTMIGPHGSAGGQGPMDICFKKCGDVSNCEYFSVQDYTVRDKFTCELYSATPSGVPNYVMYQDDCTTNTNDCDNGKWKIPNPVTVYKSILFDYDDYTSVAEWCVDEPACTGIMYFSMGSNIDPNTSPFHDLDCGASNQCYDISPLSLALGGGSTTSYVYAQEYGAYHKYAKTEYYTKIHKMTCN
jgi:hypothetical protein